MLFQSYQTTFLQMRGQYYNLLKFNHISFIFYITLISAVLIMLLPRKSELTKILVKMAPAFIISLLIRLIYMFIGFYVEIDTLSKLTDTTIMTFDILFLVYFLFMILFFMGLVPHFLHLFDLKIYGLIFLIGDIYMVKDIFIKSAFFNKITSMISMDKIYNIISQNYLVCSIILGVVVLISIVYISVDKKR